MIENTIEIHAPLKKLSRKQLKLPAYVTIRPIFTSKSAFSLDAARLIFGFSIVYYGNC